MPVKPSDAGKTARRRPFPWGVAYGVALAAFTVFVLLDAFVIPRSMVSALAIDTASVVAAEASAASGSSGVAAADAVTGAGGTGGSSGTDAAAATATQAAAQVTETSYVDSNVSVSISTLRTDGTDVYVADVQVSSAAYLKTALAQDSYGRNVKDTTSAMAESHDAILAINGDYYGFRDAGFVVRNGVLYRSVAQSGTDALVVYGDGTLAAVDEDATDASGLLQDGAWQVLSFGPVLVQDGTVAVDQNTEVDQAKASNPRTAIGMVSPLHYIVVVSDGRTSSSEGLSLYQLAQVMQGCGCTFAYNLDGGGSSTLWFNGEVVNNPTSGRSSGEREVSDIVYFG